MSDVSIWDQLVASGVVVGNAALGALTTYRFGGTARWLADVPTRNVLNRVLDAVDADPVPVLVIGRGSNLIISDDGFDGLVLKLTGDFTQVRVDGDLVHAGGAVPLPRLARSTVRQGRLGLEFYVGIPGSVGGAVVMNAGCFGTETADVLVSAEVMDLAGRQVRIVDPAGLEHRYRHSNVAAGEIVLSATFRTEPGSVESGEAKMLEITRWRKRTQPGGTYNAGSVFKNPPGDAAGRLIDECGLKGWGIGGVRVSERHANFFVADDDARAQDVFDLVAAVRNRVHETTGVLLDPEVRFAGTFDPATRQLTEPLPVEEYPPLDEGGEPS